jgi:hypothetical protein
MSTIYEQLLHDLHVDQGLVDLIVSQAPVEVERTPALPLEVLEFLRKDPRHTEELTRALSLPTPEREGIARQLALDFWGSGNPRPAGLVATAEPDPEVPLTPYTPSEYRLVFGCRYERADHPSPAGDGGG